MPRCYVASPLGFFEAGRHYYRTVLVPALSAVVSVVDPWALSTTEEFETAEAAGLEEARKMALLAAERNVSALRTCDLLVACLDGAEPDSGTCGEIGFAAALGLRCYGLRTDSRQSGEAGVSVNLQIEGFIVFSGGVVLTGLDELIAELAEYSAKRTEAREV